MKPINKMKLAEAQAALAREESYRARGLSYSNRRLGALRARIAILQPEPKT